MILKLLPDQITKYWDAIRYGLLSTDTPSGMLNAKDIQSILCDILKGSMQCWVVCEEDKEIKGFILTSIYKDNFTQSKSLLIYSLYMFTPVSTEKAMIIYQKLEAFAKASDCTKLIAYTTNEQVLSIAKKFNFMHYHYLIKEV